MNRDFVTHFRREGYGVFRCMKPAVLYLADGKKIEVASGTMLILGALYMGLNLGELLEREYQRDQHGSNFP